MKETRLLMLLVVVAIATNSLAADSVSQGPDTLSTPSAATPTASNFDLRVLIPSLNSSSQLGLKPQSQRARAGIGLPFGLHYNPYEQSLLMPMDPKNEWGVGFHLDLSPSRAIELAPPSSPLGLQPKRTPGVILQKRF